MRSPASVDWSPHDPFLSEGSPARRGNRRRAQVFLIALVLLLVASLAYTWLRPAEYRASGRISIDTAVPIAGAERAASAISTDLQLLTSRPVLERAVEIVQDRGYSIAPFGPDPVAGLQAQLRVQAAPQTNVVELVTTGGEPELLAGSLNAIVEAYADALSRLHNETSSDELAAATEEVTKLESTVKERRQGLERLRARYNIVSGERDDNQVLARVRTQNAALEAAANRLSSAETHLRETSDAASAGKPVARAQDRAALGGLEQQVAQVNDELAELNRVYTPDYLAKDPKVKMLYQRKADLERKLANAQEVSKRAALVEAQEELSNARAARRQLETQVASDRQEVAQFSARFNEYRSQQEALAKLEETYRAALQKKASLEGAERGRTPIVRMLEAATVPVTPWRPDYWRDSGIAAGASLAAALLIMLLVELFNRPDRQPSVVLSQRIAGLAIPAGVQAALGAPPVQAIPQSTPALLEPPQSFPRELDSAEVRALVDASDPPTRALILLLLSGVSPEELAQLRWRDVDSEGSTIHISERSPRDLLLDVSVASAIADVAAQQSQDALLANSDEMDARILSAAHDAGLQRPVEVTAAALRHTYIAYLVRQGIRFADLPSIVGPLSAQVLASYSAYTSTSARLPAAQINRIYPGVAN